MIRDQFETSEPDSRFGNESESFISVANEVETVGPYEERPKRGAGACPDVPEREGTLEVGPEKLGDSGIKSASYEPGARGKAPSGPSFHHVSPFLSHSTSTALKGYGCKPRGRLRT